MQRLRPLLCSQLQPFGVSRTYRLTASMSPYFLGLAFRQGGHPGGIEAVSLLPTLQTVSRIGIFGGTFDPVHVGHLVVAVWVRAALGLDTVELVVANEPWQKLDRPRINPPQDRLAMVEAAVDGIAGVVASSVEINRGGPTYTVDTLEAYRGDAPGGSLYLILGSDAAGSLDTWQRHEEIAEMAEIVVVDRPGAVGERPPAAHMVVDCPLLDLSSTQVRQWADAGQPLDGLIPPTALAYGRRRGLYG